MESELSVILQLWSFTGDILLELLVNEDNVHHPEGKAIDGLHFRYSADTDLYHGEAVFCLVLSFYLIANFACEDDE